MFPVHPDWFNKRQNKRRMRPPTQIDPPPRGGRGFNDHVGWKKRRARPYSYGGGGRARPGTTLSGGRRPWDWGGRRRRPGVGTGSETWNRRRRQRRMPTRPWGQGPSMPPPITSPVAGGGQPGFDWRRWGAGRGGYTDQAFRKKFEAHEKKFGRGSWDRWKSDPSKGKYWKGMPNWMTNSIAWGQGTEAPTWQDMGYKDEDSFNKTWKMGGDGRSLVRADGQQILDAPSGTWWRGRAGGGAPRPPVAGTAPHMPGQPPARRPQMPRRSPRRRSRVPYNQRGYGRRFDRFRRGLGRRRPVPIRGGMGRPRPGGGRGRPMGFAHPYGIARRMGYKGTLAEWMQTEDGKKYQQNIEAGYMY